MDFSLSRPSQEIPLDLRTFNLAKVDGGNLTAIGGSDPDFGKVDISNILRLKGRESAAAWRKMFQKEPPERGAHLYYRYENGKLTLQSLCPWTMNDRIIDVTGIDLTANIFSLGRQ